MERRQTSGSSLRSARRSSSGHEVPDGLVGGDRPRLAGEDEQAVSAIGSATVVSTITVAGTWVRNEPRTNRMPTFRLPALYGTGVIFDDGPLSRARTPSAPRMKIMSQHASAAAR